MIRYFASFFLLLILIAESVAQVPGEEGYLHFKEKYPAGTPLTTEDELLLSSLPELKPDVNLLRTELPDLVDNSTLPYLRPVFEQVGASCGQACAIGYNFTYEINAARGLPADTSVNQYATHFTWNFMNGGQGWFGVSYFHSFEVLRLCGNPNVNDYGGEYFDDGKRWINGYDAYYNSMHNRIRQVYRIKTDTEEGIENLKHWLYDHRGQSDAGGVASFYANVPYNAQLLNDTTPEGGKHVLTNWYPQPTHAMTIVGYNDSIRWDYNEDGQYTNDIDINGDGVVDPKDWEIGAVRFVNSYGYDHLDSGFCYMMYKVLADELEDGGLWNQEVHVVDARADYSPGLTYKVTLTHDYRKAIRVRAGVSTDTSDIYPEKIISFPIFNYQGGGRYMQGHDTAASLRTIEFGLDITPLRSFLEAGSPARFFLLVDENDPFNNGSGVLESASLIDYNDGVTEIPFQGLPLDLTEDGLTKVQLIHAIQTQEVEIVTEELPPFTPGEEYTFQLEASGGVEPYRWIIEKNYRLESGTAPFPVIEDELLIPNDQGKMMVEVPLPFEFSFFGKMYDTLYAHMNGFIQTKDELLPWPYMEDHHLMFRAYGMISPFLNKDLTLTGDEEGVWYSGNADSTAFRWKLGIPEGDIFEFAVILFPDGEIRFHYSDCDGLDFMSRVSGISEGNNHSYFQAFSEDGVPQNATRAFKPCRYPAGMDIDNSGVFQGAPGNPEQIFDIRVTAIDDRNISDSKTLPFSTGLLADFTVISGGDGRIEYGENVTLDLHLKNNLTTDITNLFVKVSSNNPYLTIIDSNQVIGTLAAGESMLINDAFSFDVAHNVPDRHSLFIGSSFLSDQQDWYKELIYTAYAPSFTVTDYYIDDADGILEPGETSYLVVTVQNQGHADSWDITGLLAATDPAVTINTQEPQEYGDLQRGESADAVFQVTAEESTPFGYQVMLGLDLEDAFGLSWNDSLLLRLGRVPVAVIDLDPNNHSAPGIFETLQEMDIIAEMHYKIPQNMEDYQSLFICLGIYYSNHVLTWKEGEDLAEYLDNGGNIYMEGHETWLDDPMTPVRAKFNILPEGTIIPFDTIAGIEGTFTEGLLFYNGAPQPLNFYWLEPGAGAFPILQDNGDLKSCAIAYDAGDYRTIGTVFELGLLDEIVPPGAEEDLVNSFLDFFGVLQYLTGTDDLVSAHEAKQGFAYPNPFNDNCRLAFTLEEAGTVNISLHTISGRQIGRPFHKRLGKGSHAVDIDDIPGAAAGLKPGVYIYRMVLDDRVLSGKLVKL